MQDPLALEQPLAPLPARGARQLGTAQLIVVRLLRRKGALLGALFLLLLGGLTVCAPLVTPEDPYNPLSWDVFNQNLSPRLSPVWYDVFGTNDGGQSVLVQILWGARVSLSVGLIGALSALVVGGVAGYVGGPVETLLMRVTDVFLVLPFLALVVCAARIFGAADLWALARIFAVFSWPTIARMTRAVYVRLREEGYVEAARAIGMREWRIAVRHVLPNALSPIVVAGTLIAASCITAEAAIDFFRLGLQYPDSIWGTVMIASRSMNTVPWWVTAFPGIALAATVLAINALGGGLDSALDVRA